MKMLVRDYFDQIYRKQNLPTDATDRYIKAYGTAIFWLKHIVGAEPKLTDLKANNLRLMQAAMYRMGLSYSHVKKMRGYIGAIWKHAWHYGLVDDYQLVPTARPGIEIHRFLLRDPGEGTVRKFYRAVARGELLEKRLCSLSSLS